MDNLGGLVAAAFAGLVLFVGAIALIIGLTIGYFVGSPSDENIIVKQERKAVEGNASQASSTRIKFDLRK